MNLYGFAVVGLGPRIDARVDVGNPPENGNDHCQSHVVRTTVSSQFAVLSHGWCLCRPGPPITRTGAEPTYFVPWRVSDFRTVS